MTLSRNLLLLFLLLPGIVLADCDDIRWDADTSTFSVWGSDNVCTLSDIYTAFPDTDALIQVDEDEGIWYLDADLLVRTGATLQLHGEGASGTTNRLYLSSSDTSFHTIDASWGVLSIHSTEIFGWDLSSGSIDDVEGTGEYHTSYANGRSFIKARSRLDDSGTNDVATLSVKSSELGYLGYNKGESYGLSASVEESSSCDTSLLRIWAVIQGNQIHHTYRGFSGVCLIAETSVISGNEIHDTVEDAVHLSNNISYVNVNANYISRSGDAAISCSDACDYLTVNNNILTNNLVGVELDGDVDYPTVTTNSIKLSQEKGILLSDVEGGTISANQISCTGGSEQTDCGGVLYDETAAALHLVSAYNNDIRSNVILAGQRGISLSGDSAVNVIDSNSIEDQEGYGLFVYLSDADTSTTGPYSNTFSSNTFSGNAEGIFFLTTETNSFTDNTLETAEDASVLVRSSTKDRFTFEAFEASSDDDRLVFRVRGETDAESLAWLNPTDDMDLDLSLDQYSEVAMLGTSNVWSFDGKSGLINRFEPGSDLMYLSAESGLMYITGTLQKINLAVDSDSELEIEANDLIADGVSWILTGSAADQVIDMEITDVAVSSTWTLYRNGESLGNLVSDSSGVIEVEETLDTVGEAVTYRLVFVSSNSSQSDDDTTTVDDGTDTSTDTGTSTGDSTTDSSVSDEKTFGVGSLSLPWLALLVLGWFWLLSHSYPPAARRPANCQISHSDNYLKNFS